jgi:hypothetical protein
MSKVEELRKNYNRITETTFKKFVNGDNTPTKKYLKYMLDSWMLKLNGYTSIPSAEILISQVKLFDSLLPYNPNKDIYSQEYRRFSDLANSNFNISKIKEEKTFNRDEHISVIYEDDDILFLIPKTFKGSVKYGANTKWCTAGQGSESTFNSYVRAGFLAYLIDKKNEKKGNYNKLAFYCKEKNLILSGKIEIFNQVDTRAHNESDLFGNGWDEEMIIKLIFKYRLRLMEEQKYEKSLSYVKKITSFFKSFEYEKFIDNVQMIKEYDTNEYDKFKDDMKILNEIIEQTTKGLKKFA